MIRKYITIVNLGYVKGVPPKPKSQQTIYRTLAFFSLEADSTSSNAAITTLDTLSTPQIYRLYFVIRYLSIFLYINIFGVLCVISRVQADVFPTVPALHDLDLSSGIL